jgi:Transposase DDE domain
LSRAKGPARKRIENGSELLFRKPSNLARTYHVELDMTTSKSPRKVAQVAYDAACEAVPSHRHRFSPKKFTQPQLLACLVLKEFLRLDYRGLAEHLADHSELTRSLALTVIPHYTTFQKAAARLLKAVPSRKLFDSVLDRALREKVRKRRVPLAAIDGTGMESRHTSRYYVKRRSRTAGETQDTSYAKYPKVVLVTDCQSHLVLSAVPGRGPGSDLQQFKAAIRDAAARARIGTLLGDADYDAESVHEHVRNTYGIRTIIPPERGRPSKKLPVGRWRRWIRQQFGRLKTKYGQRWQTETVNSMIKRRLGSALRARSYWSQCREIILRAITHNVMIVACG